jgi:superfamily II DNA or RNA helicase
MTVYLQHLNGVYSRLTGDRSGIMEIADELTFEVPNARFHPKVRHGFWDGKIRLVNSLSGEVYTGLYDNIRTLCREQEIDLEVDPWFNSNAFSIKEAKEFIATLDLPFEPYDYQIDALVKIVRDRRGLFVSPTSSGKTLITYLICKYFNLKTLIIVPTTNLLTQLVSDFKEFGYTDNVHEVFQGQDKSSDSLFTVALWNSIYKLPRKYYDQYDVVIGDEAHLFDAKSLKSLMEKTHNAEIKVGLTGSLKDSKTHELALTGLFGPKHQTIETHEMIERKISSDIRIKVLMFTYPQPVIDYLKQQYGHEREVKVPGGKKKITGMQYKEEVDFILKYPHRNKFIKNLILSLEGNTVVLYHRVKDHGDVLRHMVEETGKIKVFNIQGNVSKEDREQVRQAIEQIDRSCTFASSKTFSTGTSIDNIQNVILVQPLASRVNNLQSIGRGLRKDGKTNVVTLFDLADDIPIYRKPRTNFLLKHALTRLKLYAEQKFKFKVYNVGLK